MYPHTIHGTNGIFTYIWPKFMVNVGKYTIHGCYGIFCFFITHPKNPDPSLGMELYRFLEFQSHPKRIPEWIGVIPKSHNIPGFLGIFSWGRPSPTPPVHSKEGLGEVLVAIFQKVFQFWDPFPPLPRLELKQVHSEILGQSLVVFQVRFP